MIQKKIAFLSVNNISEHSLFKKVIRSRAVSRYCFIADENHSFWIKLIINKD